MNLSELNEREIEYEEIIKKLSVPQSPSVYQTLNKRLGEIKDSVMLFKEYKRREEEMRHLKELLMEEKGEQLLKDEQIRLKNEMDEVLAKIERLDSNEEKKIRKIIMEIRPGTGGEESCLFVADLFKMYTRYALKEGFKVELISSNPTGIGGFKEIIFGVSGEDVYEKLRFESGVHRVQRVPITESSGRIHTSAATVAVLPEPLQIEIEIKGEDLKIEVFRASAPGGQHMQKTESAVRITHIPTGLVVSCQDGRSQMQNKESALRVLKARLYEKKKKEQEEKIAKERKEQVKTGDRSEKIRTYNFPQNRITDHRINLSLFNLSEVLDGNLDPLIEKIKERIKT